MAEEDTTQTAPAGIDPALLSRLIQQLTSNAAPPVASDPNAGASSREGRTFTSLLGEAAGGGQQYGTTGERESGGLSALGALGARMLQASDWSVMPHTLGSIIGHGLGAARGSLGESQSVSAARQAAAQDYAHQQQQDQLARLKEALPLLTLQQQQAAIRAMPATLLGGGANTNIGAAGASAEVPPEYLPFYQEASRRTGIPVEVLIAQHAQESGFNPNATGKAGEIGIGQILPATAASPGYGLKPIDAKALRDPKTNINFAADYLAARAKAAGADLNTPEGRAKALAAYNGGGDPNYVENVTRRLPGAGAAVSKLTAPPSGQTATAPPPPAPGFPTLTSVPGAPTVVPPGSPAPGGRATLPPPEPPMAGTAQVAGPGAPTAGGPPPQMPGTDATVADIKAGMIGAGADPTTLAPGPGSAPGAQPGAAVLAQASALPPGLDPNSHEAYSLLHPIAPTPEERALFAAQPDAGQLRGLEIQKQNLERQYQLARAQGNPAGMQKAMEDLNTVTTAENTLRENARKLGVDTQAKFYENARKQRFDAWTAEQKQRTDDAQAAQKQRDAITLKEVEGQQSRLSTEAGAIVENNKVVRDALNKDSIAASGRVQSLEGLRALSDNVPDSSTTLQSLANVRYGGTTLLNHLTTLGLISKDTAGPIQMLQSGISGTIAELRAGMPMGSLSDRDLSFIESMGPSLYENQATRSAVISYLQQAARAKMRFNTVYNEEMTRPGANSASALEKAREIMDTKHPTVPQMPADLYANRMSNDPGWQDRVTRWAEQNGVKKHTLFRKPDGSLELVK